MDDPSLQVHRQRLWFALAGRGAAGALAGVLLMSDPWRSLRAMVGIFAGYLLVDGVLSFYAASRARRSGTPGKTALLVGITDVAAAVLVVVMPALLPVRLVGGLRAVACGVCDGLLPRRRDVSELLTLAGIVAVALGVLLLAWPGPGSVALPWLLGLEASVSGALLVAGGTSEIKRASATTLPQGA